MLGIHIPARFWSVCYDGDRIPDAFNDLSGGANCQRFAYALLAVNGVRLPPFRSSELWADEIHTVRVQAPEQLDLLLFHDGPDAFGAHVAVCTGGGNAIHLSKDVGSPQILALDDFAHSPKYRYYIGAKRAL
ncbi:hypothetical protein [Phenylobacterium sp.]|uniref:hypothetical protein n=1 Tax=Phenylobacterium sp. TaxID=1871053 RepID=UPI00273507B9|nr:hypothetical protein [Phenylobacterium sp.]MDP3852541.1 hypothetical protein [Phenylobacterium sp.]